MLDARPPLDADELHAVRVALDLERDEHPAYASAWRRVALLEARTSSEEPPDGDGYALSPRSTRGATRA